MPAEEEQLREWHSGPELVPSRESSGAGPLVPRLKGLRYSEFKKIPTAPGYEG